MQRDAGEVFIVQGKILKHKTCMINVVESCISFLRYLFESYMENFILDPYFLFYISFEDVT